ncbi:MAG: hypothetical protein DRI46_09480, partial [Chloroflexi bacterium]
SPHGDCTQLDPDERRRARRRTAAGRFTLSAHGFSRWANITGDFTQLDPDERRRTRRRTAAGRFAPAAHGFSRWANITIDSQILVPLIVNIFFPPFLPPDD